MPWAVAAAAIGVVGSVASASMGANAAEDAANAQAAAAAAASDERTRAFNEAKGELSPYAALGKEALPSLRVLSGLEGSPEDVMATLAKYPGYQFALSEGAKQVGNLSQAAGSRVGGNALRAAIDYGQNSATKLYQTVLGNYMGIADFGKSASGAIANAALNTGNNIAEDKIGIGNARAAGIVGSANAWSNGISGAANSIAGVLGNTGFQDFAKGFGTDTGSWSGAINANQLSLTPDGRPAGSYVMR